MEEGEAPIMRCSCCGNDVYPELDKEIICDTCGRVFCFCCFSDEGGYVDEDDNITCSTCLNENKINTSSITH